MTPEAKSITVAELALCIEGEAVGDATRELTGVQPLETAGPSDLSWLGSVKYLPQLKTTAAGAVLVPSKVEVPPDRTVIRVPDPDLAMCSILRMLSPAPAVVPPGVHPSAVVGTGVEIAESAAIGPHAVIGDGAKIGASTQLHAGVFVGAGSEIGCDCVLWPSVVVRERCRIGNRVVIHANSTIGADGYGYLQRGGKHIKIPQVGGVEIEDDVEIGANTCVDRARSGVTRIRRGTKIDNLVQIAHNCDIGEDCIIIGQCGISGSTRLCNNVVLAGQVGLVDHLNIGEGAMVAAQSGITGDVPPGKLYRGTPAVEHGQFARQQVLVRRLPQMVEQLKELIKRVERLESSTTDNS